MQLWQFLEWCIHYKGKEKHKTLKKILQTIFD